MPISRWVDKTTMVHFHNGILFSHKKEENFNVCDGMDGPGEHYAKWNKPVRERQIPYGFIHMWNIMNKLKKQGKWGQTHRWTAGWQLGKAGKLGGGGIEQKAKRTHGHGQQCGDCWEEGGIRGLNDNGNTIKIKLKKNLASSRVTTHHVLPDALQ